MEGALSHQAPAPTVEEINPSSPACWSMTAFVANINPNEDSPEAKEQHKQGVVTFEVVSIHLYPYQDWCKENVLEVAKVGGKSFVPRNDLPGKLPCHTFLNSFKLIHIQHDPCGLAQGFVDLDLGCSTILIGQ